MAYSSKTNVEKYSAHSIPLPEQENTPITKGKMRIFQESRAEIHQKCFFNHNVEVSCQCYTFTL